MREKECVHTEETQRTQNVLTKEKMEYKMGVTEGLRQTPGITKNGANSSEISMPQTQEWAQVC